MALTSSQAMLAKALENGYAVGAFNISNMETIQAVAAAAKAANAPVIIQATPGTVKYAGIAYLLGLVRAAAEGAGAGIALHLDHGEDFETCKLCVDAGFTSVMIDGSKLDFADNVALTKEVCEYAHERGVPVEAELGRLAGIEESVEADSRAAAFTAPGEAAAFVAKTGVDSLAVAIGTSHGAYKFKEEPYLDFERLKKIRSLLPRTPLVLHGASTVPAEFVARCNEHGGDFTEARGVPEDMIRKAAQFGICKVNIATDLKLVFMSELRKYLNENPSELDPRKYLSPARASVSAFVRHIIRDVLGAAERA